MYKIFTKNEILSEENFYLINKRKKIIVFVPDSHLESVFLKMSSAGAGIIGDYDKCSFRIKGTGSFRPKKKAKPFSGKIEKISFEKETRLEMECSPGIVTSVINAMLIAHPYEEIAYEIYDFFKLDKNTAGKIIELNRKINLKVILSRLNKKIITDTEIIDGVFKRIVITDKSYNSKTKESAMFFDSDMILIFNENKYKLINLTL